MVDPIDFNGLYIQQLQAKRAQEGGVTTPAPGAQA
jgi:preprotein translocase subunit SecB